MIRHTFSLLAGVLLGGLATTAYFINSKHDCFFNETQNKTEIQSKLEKQMTKPFHLEISK
jgi:hypothetical protein